MIRFRPRSMLTLVATGYLLVAMPLMISIPVAYRSVGELTRQSQRLVADTASLSISVLRWATRSARSTAPRVSTPSSRIRKG